MDEPQLEFLAPGALIPYAGNARIHSAAQIRQIARSIREFGFITPVLADRHNQLIAGHGRLSAAIQLGLGRIPVVRIEHLSESQIRAYRLADNKIAQGASWDDDLLRVELEFLMDVAIDFDTDLTGFSTPEVNLLLNSSSQACEDPPIPPAPAPHQAVSCLDDLWALGPHRVICGDCRDAAVLNALFCGEIAQMIMTDLPFNVRIEGHVCGNGTHHHDAFSMASGEMSKAEFIAFLTQFIDVAAAHCEDGALFFIFM